MKHKILFSSLLCAVFLSGAASAQTNGQFSTEQTKQIQQIVHDYLVQNPQVLVEASQALQQQQMQTLEKTATAAIAKNAKDIFDNPASPVVGNANGDVTLVEFMDYQCAHCKEMEPVVQALLASDKNLRVVFKELPIFGNNSEFAAKAALAAQKQGKFAEFHIALLKDTNPLTKEEVLKIAKSVGLNTDQLVKDAASTEYDQQIKDNYKLAKALGLMGTPALIVAPRTGEQPVFIPGATNKETLEKAIAQVRKK